MSSLANLFAAGEREPERRLWRSIVVRAILDACGCVEGPGNDKFQVREAEREKAVRWFRRQPPSFQEACCHSGLDAKTVREAALEMISEFEPVWKKHGYVNRATIAERLGITFGSASGAVLTATGKAGQLSEMRRAAGLDRASMRARAKSRAGSRKAKSPMVSP